MGQHGALTTAASKSDSISECVASVHFSADTFIQRIQFRTKPVTSVRLWLKSDLFVCPARKGSGMKCLTAMLPPTSGSALTVESCAGGASPAQQWTFVGASLRLVADTSFGGSASDAPGSTPFLLRKCLTADAAGAKCDAELHGWHGMSACFGPTPTACWIDLVGKGKQPGGCPPNPNAELPRPADATHCCVGPFEAPAPPPPPLGRYRVASVHVAVAAPTKSYVFDVGGSGVEITNVTVAMPDSLSGSASVCHTTGTAFSITHCNATHDNIACSTPGYPRDCLLFFDKGTDSGDVRHNSFQMGCCAFEGYSASGVPDPLDTPLYLATHHTFITSMRDVSRRSRYCWRTTTSQISHGRFSRTGTVLHHSALRVCQRGSHSLGTCAHCVAATVCWLN